MPSLNIGDFYVRSRSSTPSLSVPNEEDPIILSSSDETIEIFNHIDDNAWYIMPIRSYNIARIRLNSQGSEISSSESESDEESEHEEDDEVPVYGWRQGWPHETSLWYNDLFSDVSNSSDESSCESSSDEDIVYDDEIEYVNTPAIVINRDEYDEMSIENNYGDDEADENDDILSENDYRGNEGDDDFDDNDEEPLVSVRDPFLSDAMVPRDDEIDLLYGNQTARWLHQNSCTRINLIMNEILNGDDNAMKELP